MSIFNRTKKIKNTVVPDVRRDSPATELTRAPAYILPEVMPCTYMEFISREYDNATKPIQQEIDRLTRRQFELQELYAKEVKAVQSNTSAISEGGLHTKKEFEKKRKEFKSIGGNASAIIEASLRVKKDLEKKQKELRKAEYDNQLDLTARSLAFKLDQAHEREALYALYLRIGTRLSEMIHLMNEASSLATRCGINATALETLPVLGNTVDRMNRDLMYRVTRTDKAALRAALNERLAAIQVDRERNAALLESLKEKTEA